MKLYQLQHMDLLLRIFTFTVFIDLMSNITLYPNLVLDARFHCGVTDLMDQEIGEYDFEYKAQIAYI